MVTNTGQQASSAIVLGLSSTASFSLVAPTTGDCVSGTTTLAAGGFCNVRISFPGANGGGMTSATLTATATAGGTATLVLSGVAHKFQTVVMAPAPGSSVDFGTVIVGAAPKTQTYIVTNTGDDAANPVGIAIFPTDTAYSFSNPAPMPPATSSPAIQPIPAGVPLRATGTWAGRVPSSDAA